MLATQTIPERTECHSYANLLFCFRWKAWQQITWVKASIDQCQINLKTVFQISWQRSVPMVIDYLYQKGRSVLFSPTWFPSKIYFRATSIHFTLVIVKRKYQDTNRSQEPILNVRYFLLKPPNNNRMIFLYFYGNQTPKLLYTLMV